MVTRSNKQVLLVAAVVAVLLAAGAAEAVTVSAAAAAQGKAAARAKHIPGVPDLPDLNQMDFERNMQDVKAMDSSQPAAAQGTGENPAAVHSSITEQLFPAPTRTNAALDNVQVQRSVQWRDDTVTNAIGANPVVVNDPNYQQAHARAEQARDSADLYAASFQPMVGSAAVQQPRSPYSTPQLSETVSSTNRAVIGAHAPGSYMRGVKPSTPVPVPAAPAVFHSPMAVQNEARAQAARNAELAEQYAKSGSMAQRFADMAADEAAAQAAPAASSGDAEEQTLPQVRYVTSNLTPVVPDGTVSAQAANAQLQQQLLGGQQLQAEAQEPQQAQAEANVVREGNVEYVYDNPQAAAAAQQQQAAPAPQAQAQEQAAPEANVVREGNVEYVYDSPQQAAAARQQQAAPAQAAPAQQAAAQRQPQEMGEDNWGMSDAPTATEAAATAAATATPAGNQVAAQVAASEPQVDENGLPVIGSYHEAVELDEGNFDAYMAQHPNTVVEWYAPWCPHCKDMAPTMDKVAAFFNEQGGGGYGKGVTVARVDADKYGKLADKYGVDGFPKVMFFKNSGANIDQFQGTRVSNDLEEWACNESGAGCKPEGASLELAEATRVRSTGTCARGDRAKYVR